MTAATGRPRVVHLSADFPDPIASDKTHAIRRLVDLTADRFDHAVFSLNRVGRPGAVLGGRIQSHPFGYGEAIVYPAPPLGLFHATKLNALGRHLASRIDAMSGPRPSLIVGHKLTIEGIAAAAAARMLAIPYALCVQGNTDAKVLAARPDLTPLLRRVWRGAGAIFPFAPWAARTLERQLGAAPGMRPALACPLRDDDLLAPVVGGQGLVSAFNLDGWQTKNLKGLLAAQRAIAASKGASPALAIVGGGSLASTRRCQDLARHVPGVIFEGATDPAAMKDRLNRAIAMVLPSRRETFGMVFLEALFAGCPIIYPAGAAVDGYFEGAPFALRVDATSPASIAAAMQHAVDQEAQLKAALAQWQRSDAMSEFTRPSIADAFSRGLEDAIRARGARLALSGA